MGHYRSWGSSGSSEWGDTGDIQEEEMSEVQCSAHCFHEGTRWVPIEHGRHLPIILVDSGIKMKPENYFKCCWCGEEK